MTTAKRECDCFVPALEGAGQHSPGCAIFKCDSCWYTDCPPYCGCDCHKANSKPQDSQEKKQ